jgi:RNA polymerase sigma factor (TIGR02999 family)
MVFSEGVTVWLVRWSEGDEGALEQLTSLVYQDLHRLAVNYLRPEREGHTLQATDLVHEAYLQIRNLNRVEWQNRAHFIGMCAHIMRRILVEHARKRQAAKRGGNAQRVALDTEHDAAAAAPAPQVDLFDLDVALDKLAKTYPRQAEVVELRFFGGLTAEETLDVLRGKHQQLSLRTVERDWRFARAWLYGAISPEGAPGGQPA